MNIKIFLTNFFSRYACGIPIDDNEGGKVIVTGGFDNHELVSVYGVNGWVEDLAPLNIGRRTHGCGSFFSGVNRVLTYSYCLA